MASQDFRSIWAYLQSRKDLDNIVCEMVGRLMLPGTVTIDSVLHGLCVIKMVLDLQRVYLQPTSLSKTARLLLLSPHRVVELLRFTLESSKKCKTSNVSPNSEHLRSLELHVCQVVLSGIRALLLIKQKCPGNQPHLWDDVIKSLKKCLGQWPAGNTHFDSFVQKLTGNCLEGLFEDSGAERATKQCAHYTVPDLPDISEGLLTPDESVVESVQLASHCIQNNCDFSPRSFWVWADTRLALIAAIVQSAGKEATTQTVKLEDVGTEAASRSLPDICSMIQQSIFETDREGRRSRYGNYLDMMEPVPYSITDEWGMFSSRLTLPQSYYMPSTVIKAVLDSLQTRTAAIVDSDGALKRLRGITEHALTTWTCTQQESRRGSSSEPMGLEALAFVLRCQSLHPVAYTTLEDLIKASPFRKGLEELEKSVPDFAVNIRCPRCSDEYDVSRVRRVDLLYDISRELRSKVSPVSVAADEAPDAHSGPEASDADERPSSAHGLASAPWTAPASNRDSFLSASNSNHTRKPSGETSSTASSTRRLRDKFKKSTPLRAPMNFSSSLSVDGDFVIVWTRGQVCCYNIIEKTWSPMVWAKDITLAAGSGNHFAVVSGAASKSASIVTVYSRHHSTQIGQTILVTEQAHSISFSREGRHLALGFETFVRLYIVDQNDTGQDFDLPKPEEEDSPDVESQCVSFASSGSRLVVATRYFPSGQVYAGIYDYDRSQNNVTFFDGPRIECRYHMDFHLSSIICHLESDNILLCASTDRNQTIIYQLNSPTIGEIDTRVINYKKYKPFPGDRIQHAVARPGLPATFIVVNDANQVFTLKWLGHGWQISALPLHSSTSRPRITKAEDKMSIAVMRNGNIRLFWTYRNAGILVTQEQRQDRFEKHESIEMGLFQPGPISL